MDACQVEEKLATVGEDAELEHSGHATQQRLATAAAALLVRDMWASAVPCQACAMA
jgi:hypothetical protein